MVDPSVSQHLFKEKAGENEAFRGRVSQRLVKSTKQMPKVQVSVPFADGPWSEFRR